MEENFPFYYSLTHTTKVKYDEGENFYGDSDTSTTGG
jgi:hypothetical protein